jgi:acyl-CoA thioesterase-1
VRERRTVAALVLCWLAISSCTSPVPRNIRSSGRILVLGDSLSVSPSDTDNFPGVLEARLRAAGLGWRVINAGIRGDTTSGGLRRIDGLLASNRPDVLILALGANDGLRGGDIERMSSNLTEIVGRAKAQKVRVLLCGMEFPQVSFFSYGREYRSAFEDVADNHDVSFVPNLLEGVALNSKMNGADGIHPNKDGAERIASTVWPALLKLLED